MSRGKRRSVSQKIGTKGESLFAAWAVDRGLQAQKVADDYGLDFLCQVFRPTSSRGVEEATGAILAVMVRSTDGDSRPRIKLTSRDAENLIRQSSPACVIAIHPSTAEFRFLFADEALIRRLQKFLTSQNQTLTIRLGDMESSISVFDEQLASLCRPGTQHRLRVLKTELKIAGAIPGCSLLIQQDGTCGSALVQIPWFGSALQVEPAKRDAVRGAAFDQGGFPIDESGVSLRPEFLSLSELADEVIIVGKPRKMSN